MTQRDALFVAGVGIATATTGLVLLFGPIPLVVVGLLIFGAAFSIDF